MWTWDKMHGCSLSIHSIQCAITRLAVAHTRRPTKIKKNERELQQQQQPPHREEYNKKRLFNNGKYTKFLRTVFWNFFCIPFPVGNAYAYVCVSIYVCAFHSCAHNLNGWSNLYVYITYLWKIFDGDWQHTHGILKKKILSICPDCCMKCSVFYSLARKEYQKNFFFVTQHTVRYSRINSMWMKWTIRKCFFNRKWGREPNQKHGVHVAACEYMYVCMYLYDIANKKTNYSSNVEISWSARLFYSHKCRGERFASPPHSFSAVRCFRRVSLYMCSCCLLWIRIIYTHNWKAIETIKRSRNQKHQFIQRTNQPASHTHTNASACEQGIP